MVRIRVVMVCLLSSVTLKGIMAYEAGNRFSPIRFDEGPCFTGHSTNSEMPYFLGCFQDVSI